MDGLVLNRIEPVVETNRAAREAVPQGLHGIGLGAVGDVFDFLETRILGIPIWAIGAGVAAYFIFSAPKQNRKRGRHDINPDMDDNEDDYGYED